MTDPKPLTERAIREIRERWDRATSGAEWIIGVSVDRGWPCYRLLGMEDPNDYGPVRHAIEEAPEDIRRLLDTLESLARRVTDEMLAAAHYGTLHPDVKALLTDLRASVEDGGEGA